MLFIVDNDYTVISNDIEVLMEIREDSESGLTTFNWELFNLGDIFYNNDCEAFEVRSINHKLQTIELQKIQ